MIRFVKLGDQINEGQNEFAFFNTVTDSFIDFNGGQVFEDESHFELFAKDDPRYERCINLMPTHDKLQRRSMVRNCEVGEDPSRMIDYLIDCTLATVEVMASRKSCPKHGEFYRQCAIAQAGIDFLGVFYPFRGRAKEFVGKETAFDYYTRQVFGTEETE